MNAISLLRCFSVVLWNLKEHPSRKHLLHASHLYGFSPVWILLCMFSLLMAENALPQYSQVFGFSARWVILCAFKACFCRKALLQTSQMWVFSPVWITLCRFRASMSANSFSQNSHKIVFLSCVRLWLFRRLAYLKVLLHVSQVNGLSKEKENLE